MEKVIFGKYPQGKNGEVLPLSWLVLAKTEKGTLMITEKVIDCKPFNESGKAWLWDTCTLRSWLQKDFCATAFSAAEMQNVNDVFLLDANEANTYFSCGEDRLAKPTEYAKARGVLEYDGNKTSWWWVRSRGHAATHVNFVNYDGYVFGPGRNGGAKNYGVRPAILVKN